MADLDTRPGPRQYLCSLRQHVREPISNAVERAQREHREVARERDAFESFADRVEGLSTAPADVQPFSSVTALPDRSATETTALRRAYQETVMAVPHYETVYDESLTENVRAEFGQRSHHCSSRQPTDHCSLHSSEPSSRLRRRQLLIGTNSVTRSRRKWRPFDHCVPISLPYSTNSIPRSFRRGITSNSWTNYWRSSEPDNRSYRSGRSHNLIGTISVNRYITTNHRRIPSSWPSHDCWTASLFVARSALLCSNPSF